MVAGGRSFISATSNAANRDRGRTATRDDSTMRKYRTQKQYFSRNHFDWTRDSDSDGFLVRNSLKMRIPHLVLSIKDEGRTVRRHPRSRRKSTRRPPSVEKRNYFEIWQLPFFWRCVKEIPVFKKATNSKFEIAVFVVVILSDFFSKYSMLLLVGIVPFSAQSDWNSPMDHDLHLPSENMFTLKISLPFDSIGSFQ